MNIACHKTIAGRNALAIWRMAKDLKSTVAAKALVDEIFALDPKVKKITFAFFSDGGEESALALLGIEGEDEEVASCDYGSGPNSPGVGHPIPEAFLRDLSDMGYSLLAEVGQEKNQVVFHRSKARKG